MWPVSETPLTLQVASFGPYTVLTTVLCDSRRSPVEQPAWGVGLVDLPSLLIEGVADAAQKGGDVFEVVKAVEQQITQVGDIRLLHLPVSYAGTDERARFEVRRFIPLLPHVHVLPHEICPAPS